MCCNSVISVSLEPPLIAFCPTRASRTWSAIRASGRCCVNVMASHHAEAARRFASAVPDRFADMSLHERPGGPALDDAVAWIDCEITDVHEAGDHLIVVAGVVALHARLDAEPLVFFRGDFGRLGTEVRATDKDRRARFRGGGPGAEAGATSCLSQVNRRSRMSR
jgi:flavin reductase (DIM6/NTAB) family NADH-FMN oxidoreductase RutF